VLKMAGLSKALGKWGEDRAAVFLQEKGYHIRERNFRWARGELDIVAEKDGVLVFVEVKTARSQRMGEPATWVTRRKQQQIGQVAQRYLQVHAIRDMDCRFDVIGVMKTGDGAEITHIENAFWLE